MDHFEALDRLRIRLDSSAPARTSMDLSCKPGCGTPALSRSKQTQSNVGDRDDMFEDFENSPNSEVLTLSDAAAIRESLDNIGLSFNADDTPERDTPFHQRFALDDNTTELDRPSPLEADRPFNKWLKHLQKRSKERRKTESCDIDDSLGQWGIFDGPALEFNHRHKKSSSGSSLGFVSAVKEASISLSSFSVAPRSRKTGVSSRHNRTDRSSKASNAGRLSEDSSYNARSVVIDQGVTDRLLQRRRVLEEIINTEENYVADIKFLTNVYVTLMASMPSLSPNLRASINVNLNEIVELHEEILGELHRVVPHSEYSSVGCADPVLATPAGGHNRWRSLDAVPEHARGASWLKTLPGMTTEPKVAAAVARILGNKMNRFFIYEEYGAKYEIMIKDAGMAYRTLPQWDSLQKGLEALASSLASINAQRNNSRKALGIGDLLVKPIQRVCKYPLLFAELLKQTPVCDCPDSHMEIENVLIRLREATAKINHATDDPQLKATMEKTWLLQDRLTLPDRFENGSKGFARGLGHIQLCGVLHVSWQTKDSVDGHYLISLLYRDFLLLASATRVEQIYTIQACIGLAEVKIEEIDNGRGIQCHTAPYSWKLVFELDHRLFEIILSACSPKEELEWRTRLADSTCKHSLDNAEQTVLTTLSLDIKPMGTVFGKPGTNARRISIHRATTIGPRFGLCQVIIKNTTAFKNVLHSPSCASINRSQSLLTTNRIPVLAPSRAERIRLETLLSDVWTRDVLPFPGMSGRARSEHPVRASASSMMRKLSVASIASNFTKRSGSMASLHKTLDDDPVAEGEISKQIPVKCQDDLTYGMSPPEPDYAKKSSLLIISGEKENTIKNAIDSHGSHETIDGGLGAVRRLATLKAKTGWALDGHRIMTPPLRTSSANGLAQNRIVSWSTMGDSELEEKDGASLTPQITPILLDSKISKHSIWRAGSKRGLRNLFR